MENKAAIISALDTEGKQFEDFLEDVEEIRGPQGMLYYEGRLVVDNIKWQIALRIAGRGNETAAADLVRIKNDFDPDVVLLVGIAGGIKDVDHGDIVFGTQIKGYEYGSVETPQTTDASMDIKDINGVGQAIAQNLKNAGYSSPSEIRTASRHELENISGIGQISAKKIQNNAKKITSNKADFEAAFRPRPPTFRASYELEEVAKSVKWKDRWHDRCRIDCNQTPNSFGEPIASGSKVVKIDKMGSEVYSHLRKYYSDCIAVEMEGLGFSSALYSMSDVEGIVIRGISDLLSDKAETEDEGFQEMAASHASAFAVELLWKYGDIHGEGASTESNGANGDNGGTSENELQIELSESDRSIIINELSVSIGADTPEDLKNAVAERLLKEIDISDLISDKYRSEQR